MTPTNDQPNRFFNNAAFNDVILKSLLMSHLAWDLMGTINSGATVFWNKMRSSQLADIQWVAGAVAVTG